MNLNRIAFVAFTLSISLFGANHCLANIVLYDSNGFEGFSLGNAVGQSGWTQVNDGVYTVQDTVTQAGSRAIRANVGALDEVSWAGPGSLNFTPGAGQTVEVQADIARTLGTGTPSFSFAVDVTSPTLNRIIRFGLRNLNDEIRGFYTAWDPNNNLVANFVTGPATFAPDTFVSFVAKLNFDTGTADLLVNGNSVTGGSNIQFANASTALGRVEFQVNSNFDADDVGYLDNLRVTAVPEPASLLLVGLGTCGLLLRRRGLNS